MGKKFRKGKISKSTVEVVPKEETEIILEQKRSSDTPIPKKEKWINKQRVLIFAARGINHRDRHLMRDLKTLMPHHRPESKMERTKSLVVINDLCNMKHCSKAVLFEGRRKRDLYMWISNIPDGPSVKFLVENVHTMGELKLTGNCLRGSRPLLSFDQNFSELPHLNLIREQLTQIFGVPYHHPKSQPFFDHVYTFTYLDKRIWFRNFQILSEDGGLAEIGPRFLLNPVKVFNNSFTGETLWKNPDYVSPSKHRQQLKKINKDRYVNRLEQKVVAQVERPINAYKFNEMDNIYQGDNAIKTAKNILGKESRKQPAYKNKKSNLDNKIKKKQLSKVREIMENKKLKSKKIELKRKEKANKK